MNDSKVFIGLGLLIGGVIGSAIQTVRLIKIRKSIKATEAEIHDLEIRLDEDRKIARLLGIDDSTNLEES